MTERLFLRLDGDPLHGPEADTPAGTLRAFPVDPALSGHVAHILAYREVMPAGHEVFERVLPDGAVRLVFNIGDPPSTGNSASHPCTAIGASAAPALVRLRGTVAGLSVTLRPGAAAALLGLPAGEIAGTAVALDDLWPGDGAALMARIAEAPHDAARVAALHAVLRRRLPGREAAGQAQAQRAVQLITASHGRRALRDVAAAVGIGERRLQQLFQTHVGLSPRGWRRLARLHGCLLELRQLASPAWADIAVARGFYDQSHLINEFQALCGLTPAEFLGRAIAGSSKTDG